MQIGDVHTIAFKLNSEVYVVEKGSQFQKIFLHLATLLSTLELSDASMGEDKIPDSSLKRLHSLRESPTISNLKPLLSGRCMQWICSENADDDVYCTIAILLSRNLGSIKMLQSLMGERQKDGGLSLSHVVSPELWTVSSCLQLSFILESLGHFCRRFSVQPEEVPRAVSRLHQIWNSMETELARRGLQTGNGLSDMIPHPREK